MIAALAFLPPAAVSIGFAYDLWNRIEDKTRTDLMAEASRVHDRHDWIVREAREELSNTAISPGITGFNPATCSAPLRDALDRFLVGGEGMNSTVRFQNLALFTPEGQVICRAIPIPGLVNVREVPWFRRLIDKGRFAQPNYAINGSTGTPIMVVAAPVYRPGSTVLAAVLMGSFDLADPALWPLAPRPDRTMTVFTQDGLVLLRQPGGEALVGKSMPDVPLVHSVIGLNEPASFAATGFDGVFRLNAVRPLATEGGSFVAASVPMTVVNDEALRVALTAASFLLLAALMVAGATWLLGDRLILRSIAALSVGTRRLLAGDYSARVNLRSGDELQGLGRTFNNMAATLEGRTAELDRERRQYAETSAQLRGIIDAAPFAIVVLHEGVVKLWSRGAESIFGYSSREILNRPYQMVVPAGRETEMNKLRDHVVQGGKEFHGVETQLLRKDRSTADIRMSGRPLLDRDGSTVGSLVVLEDVTQMKRTDAAYREKSAELATVVDAAPLPIFVTDPDGRVTMWNRAAEQVYGWTAAEVVGQPLPFIAPDKRQEGRSIMQRLRAGERITAMPAERMRKDGSQVEVLVSVAPTRDADGALRNTVSVHQDVTDMKHAERRLHETMAELAAVVLAVPVPIVAIGNDDKVTMWNPAAERMFGWQASEVTGRLIPLAPADKREEGAALSARMRAGEIIVGQPVTRVRKDGTKLELLLSGGPISSADGSVRGIMVAYLDMTEQNKVAAQLRQAQRMEVVGQLTGGLAHDFNNLLGIIIGNLDLIRDEIGARHSAADLVADAMNACLRGAQLNKSLLAFSRQQDLTPQRVDLRATLSNMANLMRRTLGEQIDLTLAVAENLPPIRVDLAQFEAAILNLAVNARDAMPNGGRLTIETQSRILDSSYAADNPDVTPGRYVMIAVSDSGTGMSPETLARAFEPFFTTKEVGQGTGLGLSMVFGFMRQSGGHVKIYSEPGKGTTVRLYFRTDPTAEITDPMKAEGEAAAVATTFRGMVLLVEDNSSLRRVALRELRQLGFDVVEADSAQTALALVENGLRPDLLFSDVIMPGPLDGAGLADELSQRLPTMKILLTSGFTERATEGASRRQLRWPLLSKPYRKAELAAAIQRVLSGKIEKVRS